MKDEVRQAFPERAGWNKRKKGQGRNENLKGRKNWKLGREQNQGMHLKKGPEVRNAQRKPRRKGVS